MGFGPDQVDRWLPYQATAVYRGWQEAHTQPEDGRGPPTLAQHQEMLSRLVH